MAEIEMPQLGETVTEGTITRWFKNVGDAVARDEVLFEVSTDKVDTEVPSPVGGTLTEIRVPEGDTVEVGTVLAVLSDGDAPAATAAPPTEAPAPAPAAQAAAPAAQAPAPAPEAAGSGPRGSRRPAPGTGAGGVRRCRRGGRPAAAPRPPSGGGARSQIPPRQAVGRRGGSCHRWSAG